MSDFRIASIDTPQARWNPERAEHLHVTYYSPKKVSNSMCENCQQLQARVAELEGVIRRHHPMIAGHAIRLQQDGEERAAAAWAEVAAEFNAVIVGLGLGQ